MSDILFRPGTNDENVWRSVVEQDEYDLARYTFTEDDIVLDIGAHIGAFTYACLQRGAGLVIAVEPDTDNANYWRHNLHTVCKAEGRSILITAAAWRSDRREKTLKYAPVGTNTGGGNTLGEDGREVAAVPFDALIVLARRLSPSGVVKLVKLDCEGAEWPILLTSNYAPFADNLCGEYHEMPDAALFPKARVDGERTYDRAALQALLMRAGFEADVQPSHNGLGLFHARRAS